LFSFGGFAKGPLRYINSRNPKLLVFLYITYRLGITKTFILYGLTGMLFLAISQLSHIQSECVISNTQQKNDFLYNQVTSSINYKTDNHFIRFICFGLDIQIEHHLFPNLPHSSLRKIQYIVQNYCNKNNIPYIEKSNIGKAIYSYIYYLYKIGNPKH